MGAKIAKNSDIINNNRGFFSQILSFVCLVLLSLYHDLA